MEAVRQSARAIDEAVNDYRGRKTPLASWLESDAVKAIAALHRMMDNLESYVAMHAPSGVAIASPPLSPGEGRGEGGTRAAGTQYTVPSTRGEQTQSEGKTAEVASTDGPAPKADDASQASSGAASPQPPGGPA